MHVNHVSVGTGHRWKVILWRLASVCILDSVHSCRRVFNCHLPKMCVRGKSGIGYYCFRDVDKMVGPASVSIVPGSVKHLSLREAIVGE